MNDASDLLNRVKTWIDGQGYPLEMRTARAFSRASFDVLQSELYKDSASGKSREIDLIALSSDMVGYTRIGFAIECKSSPKPWILFTTGTGPRGLIYRSYALLSEEALTALNKTFGTQEDAIFRHLEELVWLKKPNNVAYALRQAFTETDTAYSALTAAIKAAGHMVRISSESGYPQIRVSFPLIVVDSPLFLCQLDETSESFIKEVESGEIQFQNPDEPNEETCVRVVTLKHLPNFIREAQGEIARLMTEFRPAIEELWNEHSNSEFPNKLWDHSVEHRSKNLDL
jgi:hypothetical protein